MCEDRVQGGVCVLRDRDGERRRERDREREKEREKERGNLRSFRQLQGEVELFHDFIERVFLSAEARTNVITVFSPPFPAALAHRTQLRST